MTAGLAFRLLRAGEGAAARALPEDLADAAALGSERGAARLLRRRLLRALAAETLAVHPDRIGFERGETGRVAVVAPAPLFASLSGRGGWTALALAPHPVGVDVETWPPGAPPLDLLHPLERDEVLAAPDPDRTFLRFWTAREAWLKSDGRGFEVMPDQVRATAAGDRVVLEDAGRANGIARIVERDDAIAAIVERRFGE